MSKYKEIKCTSAKLESFSPVSSKAFNAVVLVELDNPASSFKLKNLSADLKKNGKALVHIDASSTIEVDGKTKKSYRVPLNGQLVEEIGLLQALSMATYFDIKDFTVDVNGKATVLGNIGKKLEYKDLPLTKFIKK